MDEEDIKQRIKNHGNFPGHIAIIMDGNGRWAKRQELPRVEGPDIVAGAVLQRGSVEMNLSLEVMARQVREGLEESVAKLLFDADDAREVSG